MCIRDSNTGGNLLNKGTGALVGVMTLIGRIAFILLIVILFVLFLTLGVSLITRLFTTSGSPHLIDGLKDATEMTIIHQDPSIKGSIPVIRSVNERDGLEFTWSVWIFVNSLSPEGQLKHIFHKGNDNINFNNTDLPMGLNYPNNGPGLYIDSGSNALVIYMNTFNNIVEEIKVDNLPMKKWVNVMIRCDNKNLDVYINGTIAKRHILNSVPKQNYGDVYVNMNNGFTGNLSDLWYFNKALGLSKIQSIVEKGPNLKMAGDSAISKNHPPYLSLRWYLMGSKDGYNP